MKEQTPVGYVADEKPLQFETGSSRYDSALKIELDKERVETYQWMITLQSENKVKTIRSLKIEQITWKFPDLC